jgi:hypothetical protein
MRRPRSWLLLSLALLLAAPLPALAQLGNYQLFEAGQVRPLAMSPDGSTLFAVNTPDDHLEIFSIQGDGTLVQTGSVQVGLRPVAVAARTNDEVWVVNHLSDSVSIVKLTPRPHVRRTLIVGDEPRDIVFAGPQDVDGFFTRAFVSTAHRGQQRTHGSISGVTGAGDPQLTEASGGDNQVDRNDVWVFDVGADLAGLGNTMGGTPNRILTFFSDTPRALATDGTTVYVAAFHSGNETTAITETEVCDGFQVSGGNNCGRAGAPGGVLPPSDNSAHDAAPETGIIVQKDANGDWVDTANPPRVWNSKVEFDLPDFDFFSINANSMAPGSRNEFAHVGTILYNMAINPQTGMVYVSNHESPNLTRFEGPGMYGGSTVQGHLSETRITVIDPVNSTVDPQHLNRHIQYQFLVGDPSFDPTDKDHSLAIPLQMAVSSDVGDQTIYLAAFGSGKVGVFNASDIEDANFETNFDPTAESANYIDMPNGPSGLALDESRDVLFVMTRWDNSLHVLDVFNSANTELQSIALHNPEEVAVDKGNPFAIDGRRFLYDASLTSGNGEASCASCHVFGDFDSLAWNLGNPDDVVTDNPQPAVIGGGIPFHPMKGPMTTQTLRGLSTHGGMHWRGDRTNGFFGEDPCNSVGSACSEDLSFRNFIVAFEGLVGGDPQVAEPEGNVVISAADMQKFADFALELRQPPNPVRPLDNVLVGAAAAGKTSFGQAHDGPFTCQNCHGLNESLGFFGSRGQQSFEGEVQEFKIAHLRNAYSKVGMFGFSSVNGNKGDQVRGFGFLHDGSVDTLFNFLSAAVFNFASQTDQENVEEYVLQFESDLAPAVGQQVTLHAGNHGDSGPDSTNERVSLLIARAEVTDFFSFVLNGVNATNECDVIAKVVEDPTGNPVERGYLYDPDNDLFMPDDGGAGIADQTLRDFAQTAEREVTYTCVPPGSGYRTAMDRDLDTLLNGVETNTGVFLGANDTGSNPALRDTDGDGFDDDVEVNNVPPTDPNDPLVYPGSPSGGGFAAPVPALSPLGLGLLLASLAGGGGWVARRRRA